MAKIYFNDIINFKEIDVDENSSLFDTILKSRKGELDAKRFFVDYISPEELALYDFNNVDSLKAFRRKCLTMDDPLVRMGGCNMHPDYLSKGFRYSGMKMSDANGDIIGSFDRHDGVLTYSPLLPRFFEERDLIKFAREVYFTSLTFEEIMMREVEQADEFKLHVDNYKSSRDVAAHGIYVMESINKEEMIDFIKNPSAGEEVRKKALKY